MDRSNEKLVRLGCLTCSNKWWVKTSERVKQAGIYSSIGGRIVKCPRCEGVYIKILEIKE